MTDTRQKLPKAISPLPIGSTIGILGGGQLGRMLAMAAANLGMKTHIYCPEPGSPAFDVSPFHTVAPYDDMQALAQFARNVDVVTYEFENVPAETARRISGITRLAPGEKPLRIAQDRLLEKQFLQSIDIPIAPHRPVTDISDFQAALQAIGTPCVLKTTRLGYDGKGQRIIKNLKNAETAFGELAGVELVLEAFIPFEKEISIVIARDEAGNCVTFEPSENVHKNHILATSSVPAAINKHTFDMAISNATKIASALNYVGVLAVEYFVTGTGDTQQLLVNEIAPRVHNSGHWSQDVCPVDQFGQHIRAICNWPLGDTKRLADVVMRNLIGDEINTFTNNLQPNEHPHIYGKSEPRKGRKMGHINAIFPKSAQTP
ncbi:MAG TPA: 5-(carboxyamino)imidazole ribonucleotide synthase [Devosia sp.]|nr:5-(carboxyamino)imidazole ribonucleotide synthase [Devosia sp.]